MSRIFDEDAPFGLGTRAVHAGQRPDPTTGAIMTPLYQTSTYAQEGIGKNRGYEYARGKNPTREALERNVASLEGGTHGFAFGSGMGALDSVMKLFKSGDHFVCAENMYGGTPRLFDASWSTLASSSVTSIVAIRSAWPMQSHRAHARSSWRLRRIR